MAGGGRCLRERRATACTARPAPGTGPPSGDGMLERLVYQKSSRRTLLTSSVGAGLLAAVQCAAPGIAAALGASRAPAQSAAKPFRQYLPAPRVAGVGTIRIVDIIEPKPANEATQSISVTACSADGEALQTVDRLPDGSPIQVRNGTYVDLDVSEIFSSGARWIDVLYDPVLDGTAYFVVSLFWPLARTRVP